MSQEPEPLMPSHLISAVVEYCHKQQLSPVEMDELTLDDGLYLFRCLFICIVSISVKSYCREVYAVVISFFLIIGAVSQV